MLFCVTGRHKIYNRIFFFLQFSLLYLLKKCFISLYVMKNVPLLCPLQRPSLWERITECRSFSLNGGAIFTVTVGYKKTLFIKKTVHIFPMMLMESSLNWRLVSGTLSLNACITRGTVCAHLLYVNKIAPPRIYSLNTGPYSHFLSLRTLFWRNISEIFPHAHIWVACPVISVTCSNNDLYENVSFAFCFCVSFTNVVLWAHKYWMS